MPTAAMAASMAAAAAGMSGQLPVFNPAVPATAQFRMDSFGLPQSGGPSPWAQVSPNYNICPESLLSPAGRASNSVGT